MIKKVIEIDVDEVQAVGGLDNLNKALQQSDTQTKSLKTQIREATAELIRAQEEFGDYSAAALEAAKKVALLKDKVQEAKETSDLYDPGKKFQVATNAIAAGANALQGYQAALGLIGVEGEGAQEALLKVQSAMALSQSLSVIADSGKEFRRLAAEAGKFTIVQKAITAGQWLWNAAMAANPIGAIVAAVVALIAAGVALTNYFMENSEAAKKNAAAIKESQIALENQSKTLESNSIAFDKKQKQELAMLKASGASAEAIRKNELRIIDEKIAYEKSQRAIAMNTYEKEQNILATLRAAGADEEDIKKREKLRNEAVKQYNKQNQIVKKALDERKEIEDRHNVEVLTAQTQSANEKKKKRKEDSDKARQELIDERKKDFQESLQNENLSFEQRRKLVNKSTLFDAKEKRDLIKQINKDEQTELQKQKDSIKSIETNALKEIEDIKAKSEVEKVALQKQRDLAELDAVKLSEEEKAKARLAIEEKYKLLEAEAKVKDAETKKKEEEDIKAKEELFRTTALENQKKLNEQLILAEENLQNAKRNALNVSLDILQQFAGKNKAIALGILAVQKGLAIADVISSASKGIAVSQANLATIPVLLPPGVPNPAFGFALAAHLKNVAATKIGAATSIATILSQTISSTKSTLSGGGGSGSGGGTPSGGGGGGSTAPSFNVVGNANVNQVQQQLGMQQQQQPIQAYVVANNVTTAQSLDRNIIQNASLG